MESFLVGMLDAMFAAFGPWLAPLVTLVGLVGLGLFAAVTTESSTQYTNALSTTANRLEANDYGAALRFFPFEFTQGAAAGDDGSLVNLIKLPPGRWKLVGPLSFIQWDAFGAARTLDIGHTAYVDTAGATVAAVEDSLETAIDVSSAGQQNGLGDGIAAGSGRFKEFNSSAGVVIQANVEGGTIPAGTKLSGYFVAVPS